MIFLYWRLKRLHFNSKVYFFLKIWPSFSSFLLVWLLYVYASVFREKKDRKRVETIIDCKLNRHFEVEFLINVSKTVDDVGD